MGLAWGIVCFGSGRARENVYHPMSKTRAAFPPRRAVVSRSESVFPKGHAVVRVLLILFLEEWPEPSGVSFGAKTGPRLPGLWPFGANKGSRLGQGWNVKRTKGTSSFEQTTPIKENGSCVSFRQWVLVNNKTMLFI